MTVSAGADVAKVTEAFGSTESVGAPMIVENGPEKPSPLGACGARLCRPWRAMAVMGVRPVSVRWVDSETGRQEGLRRNNMGERRGGR
jgi:hypothetical protein